jgi:hypothetical protein
VLDNNAGASETADATAAAGDHGNTRKQQLVGRHTCVCG